MNEIKQSITWFAFESLSISDDITYAIETNDIPVSFLKLNRISNSNSINYRISDKGSIRGKIEFSQVNQVENPNQIAVPYEMANGRQIGINKEWELNAVYRLSQSLNLDFSYSGRKNALDRDVINIMRMEVRLLF